MRQLKQIHHSGYADIKALVHPLNGGVFDVEVLEHQPPRKKET